MLQILKGTFDSREKNSNRFFDTVFFKERPALLMKVISVTGLIKATATGIDYALREHKQEFDMRCSYQATDDKSNLKRSFMYEPRNFKFSLISAKDENTNELDNTCSMVENHLRSRRINELRFTTRSQRYDSCPQHNNSGTYLVK